MAKFDDDRIPLQLLPPEALIEISKVLAMGAKKYGVNDWRRDTIHNIPMSRTYGSIQRHLNSWYAGEDLDPESGENHVTHAITQSIILLMQIKEADASKVDDRYNKEFKSQLAQELETIHQVLLNEDS
tara:strand:- start:13224 stop:13607 length:384 start_codon:yes stop_codon:yes gene_type:complete